jgi:hypothetical protein
MAKYQTGPWFEQQEQHTGAGDGFCKLHDSPENLVEQVKLRANGMKYNPHSLFETTYAKPVQLLRESCSETSCPSLAVSLPF